MHPLTSLILLTLTPSNSRRIDSQGIHYESPRSTRNWSTWPRYPSALARIPNQGCPVPVSFIARGSPTSMEFGEKNEKMHAFWNQSYFSHHSKEALYPYSFLAMWRSHAKWLMVDDWTSWKGPATLLGKGPNFSWEDLSNPTPKPINFCRPSKGKCMPQTSQILLAGLVLNTESHQLSGKLSSP